MRAPSSALALLALLAMLMLLSGGVRTVTAIGEGEPPQSVAATANAAANTVLVPREKTANQHNYRSTQQVPVFVNKIGPYQNPSEVVCQ
jgi:hypothetical protein